MVRNADTAGRTAPAGSFCSCTPAVARSCYVVAVANGGSAASVDSASIIRGFVNIGAKSRRFRQSVAKPFFEGLSLPGLGLVRQDNERQVHVSSRGDCDGCPPCLFQTLREIDRVATTSIGLAAQMPMLAFA